MLQKEKSPDILSSKHLNVDFFHKKENLHPLAPKNLFDGFFKSFFIIMISEVVFLAIIFSILLFFSSYATTPVYLKNNNTIKNTQNYSIISQNPTSEEIKLIHQYLKK
jgi:hypothetical protein